MPGARGRVGPEDVGDQPGLVGVHREVAGDLGIEKRHHLAVLIVVALRTRERGAKDRESGIVVRGLLDGGDHLVEATLLPAHVDQRCAVDRDGVGLTGRGADRQSVGRGLLGGVEVAFERSRRHPTKRDLPPA